MVERFPHVLNIIGNGADSLINELRGGERPVWLSEGYAADIPVAGDPQISLARAREIARAAHFDIDINIISTEQRRKKLLVADMDSTIIGCECLDELATIAGFGARVAAITERAMRGEIAFEPALRERVELLKGAPVSILEQAYRERVRLNPGARELVGTMHRQGARTVLVSGGFSYFTARVARDAGFDSEHANVLLTDGGCLSGRVAEPILGRNAKLETLEREASALGITMADVLAVGDGANDLAMLARAGLGVAYHAKPIVAEAAAARIDHGDLRALLYLQGYGDDEIVGS